MSAVLGGTQSLHTNAYDEALGLPSESAAELALRTQQVIGHETAVPLVADPLGGSYYVESLPDRVEEEALGVMAGTHRLGGGAKAIGYGGAQRGSRGEIAAARDFVGVGEGGAGRVFGAQGARLRCCRLRALGQQPRTTTRGPQQVCAPSRARRRLASGPPGSPNLSPSLRPPLSRRSPCRKTQVPE